MEADHGRPGRPVVPMQAWLACSAGGAAGHGGPPGMSFWEARCADWNTGELGLKRAGMRELMPWAFTTGSGMPIIPWARMHATNFRAWEMNCRCCAGVNGVNGSRCSQVLLADTNWGAPWVRWSAGVVRMLPLLSGSGKFGTPCARMHCEKASAFW